MDHPFSFGKNVVLVGNFNPAIFQPRWFSANGLIRDGEAEQATIEVIHSDVTVFSLDWVKIIVTRDRFQAITTQEPYFEVMRDLVLGTFKLLVHTPVKAMGLNTQAHFRMRDEEAWHGFGHRLAPKELWNPILDRPGMANLTVQGCRTDGYKGNIKVTVQPSDQVKPGISFSINDHYETKEEPLGCKEILSILEQSWAPSAEKAWTIINHLMTANI